MTQNKKPKWDGKSRISNEVYRRRFNEIFKKKKNKVINLPKDPDNHEYENNRN
tara:strand:- start:335 stop:493 length:159 start_codon:yes stop_codon:yes gene_type:complete